MVAAINCGSSNQSNRITVQYLHYDLQMCSFYCLLVRTGRFWAVCFFLSIGWRDEAVTGSGGCGMEPVLDGKSVRSPLCWWKCCIKLCFSCTNNKTVGKNAYYWTSVDETKYHYMSCSTSSLYADSSLVLMCWCWCRPTPGVSSSNLMMWLWQHSYESAV